MQISLHDRTNCWLGCKASTQTKTNKNHSARMMRCSMWNLTSINPLCIYIVVCSLQSSPPQYYPSNITTPIAVYSGTADWLVTPSEMKILLPQIKNLVKSVVIDGWEHLDFIWAMDAPQQCYNEVIHMFKNFT